MSYKLRPAITSEAKPLIGLYAESGAGKTYSALLLACGYTNGDMSKVAMIETEAGRGEAFADDPVVGGYMVCSIRENFSPKEYGAALSEVEKSGAQVCIIDSASHEWEGVGGVLSMAADNQAAGKKGVLVWQQPKILHQREFMLRMMQSSIPLIIVCMRAKFPMAQVDAAYVNRWRETGGQGQPPKMGEWVRSKDLEPKQADDILFEMFVHGWIDQSHNFHGTKYTRDNMRAVLVDGEPITVDTGKRLADWAAGRGQKKNQADQESEQDKITPDQALLLESRCTENGIPVAALKKAARVELLSQINENDYQRADDWITAAIRKRSEAPI